MIKGRVILRKNICDNAMECGGIEVCPTGALYWDEIKEEIEYNQSACIDCGVCVDNCPVEAILWGEDDEDYFNKMKEVEKDSREHSDLTVERYGASPIEPYCDCSDVSNLIDNSRDGYLLLEIFEENSINCFLHSIRVSEIKELFGNNLLGYSKVFVNNIDEWKLCEISELPCLIVLKNANLKGVINGYFDDNNKEEFFEKIKNLM